MNRLIAVEFISLDGVIQAPGYAGEDTENFAHGGWTQPYYADHAAHLQDTYRTAGGFVFGRKTFEIFADHWPTVPNDGNVIAEALNTRPKHVVSTTLGSTTWANTNVIANDVPAKIAAAKLAADGPLVLVGSSQLAHTLLPPASSTRVGWWFETAQPPFAARPIGTSHAPEASDPNEGSGIVCPHVVPTSSPTRSASVPPDG